MAKHYVSVTLEGCSVEQVNGALAMAIGPVLEQWRETHLLGIHIDVSDVTDAVEYGDRYESEGSDSLERSSRPVVDVDLYARSDLGLQPLQLALAEVVARRLSAALGVPTKIRDDG